jgi:hypothetical protein
MQLTVDVCVTEGIKHQQVMLSICICQLFVILMYAELLPSRDIHQASHDMHQVIHLMISYLAPNQSTQRFFFLNACSTFGDIPQRAARQTHRQGETKPLWKFEMISSLHSRPLINIFFVHSNQIQMTKYAIRKCIFEIHK